MMNNVTIVGFFLLVDSVDFDEVFAYVDHDCVRISI